MSADGFVEVGRAADFEDGDRAIVEIGRAEVGVLKADGEFYALRNDCPHDGGPVCEGKVQQKLVGEFQGPGERLDLHYSDECIVSCPWHGWSFDLKTGEHVGDDSYVLPTYDVVIEDGVVYVDSGK